MRPPLETFLIETPSDEALISSLNTFRRTLLKSGQKFACEAKVYRKHDFYNPMGVELKPKAFLKTYGRTKDEAAEKLNNFNRPLHQFCTKVRTVDRYYGICEEMSSTQNSCFEVK